MARDRKLFDSLRESGERHRRRMYNVQGALARAHKLAPNPPPARTPRRSRSGRPRGLSAGDVSIPVEVTPWGLYDRLALEMGRGQFLRLVQGAWDDAVIYGRQYIDERLEQIMFEGFKPAAHERARSLLLSLLTPAQRGQYRRGFIEVRGQVTGLVYRICTASTMYNVTAYGPRGEVLKLCATPSGLMPKEDKLLGQVMGLRCDERSFIRAANMRPLTSSGAEWFKAGELYVALKRFAAGEEFSLLGERPKVRAEPLRIRVEWQTASLRPRDGLNIVGSLI